jgi:competence protein ComEC
VIGGGNDKKESFVLQSNTQMAFLKKNFPKIFLLALVGITGFIWYAVFYFGSLRYLRISFFDVGQGDAIFIESSSGHQILIDGGPNERVLSKLGMAMPFWDRSIDLLILTHPDTDHLAGLVEVLKRYNVDNVVWTGVLHSSALYDEWTRLLKVKEIDTHIARAGMRVSLEDGVFFDVLSPFESFEGKSVKKINESSVIGILSHHNNSFLLTGDAGIYTARRLIWENAGSIFESDVLKVGHHGSKTSTSEEFAQAVSPEFAVIQAGKKNRYGHPKQEVLDRLSAVGARILRTDLDGDITFFSDGEKLWR